jgi:hypothetical protein
MTVIGNTFETPEFIPEDVCTNWSQTPEYKKLLFENFYIK